MLTRKATTHADRLNMVRVIGQTRNALEILRLSPSFHSLATGLIDNRWIAATHSRQSTSPQTKEVATGMLGVAPVHWTAHRDVSKHVTEHSSAQLIVQSAPSLQTALPPSPRLI